MVKQEKSGQTNKLLALRRVLRSYRWVPHTKTGSSPANLLVRHSIRTEFELFKSKKNSTSESFSTNSSKSKFSAGQLVWSLQYSRNRRPTWENAFILRSIGSMLYEVRLSTGQVCKRHQNQLRLCHSSRSFSFSTSSSSSISIISDLNHPSSNITSTISTTPTSAPALVRRYPDRIRQPPDRYSPRSHFKREGVGVTNSLVTS